MDYVVENIFKTKARKGVDAKLLQYTADLSNTCHTKIDLRDILESHLFKGEKLNHNCAMINMEKDAQRYHNTVDELKKLSIEKFVHLKGTYWKDKPVMEKDLTFIVEFLKQFNPDIESKQISINEFSEISDPKILIQDGPLGCYCSHLRAMIYGYLNFEKYTIIVEDDISLTNTENIEKYLKCIPDDWDIVCLGSIGKNKIYDEPYYKFTDEFHSLHFYIINHKCMETLFKHLYPINDQVDVLISDLIHKLNIYNIPATVHQKCISTNTQNNLYTIFNAQYYDILREQILIIKRSCMFFANKMLPDNENRNEIIVSNLLYDVLYSYVAILDPITHIDSKNQDNNDYIEDYADYEEYENLFTSMVFFIQCSKKSINVPIISYGLINDIFNVLKKFTLHNTFDKPSDELIKAYNYGATSQIYILEKSKVVIKAYNDKLRWTTIGHDDSATIFAKEIELLKKGCGPRLFDFNQEQKTIRMAYVGEPLYNDFVLPEDWKEQITEIFLNMTNNGIFYPEFKIQNISVLDGKITFLDFGLAKHYESVDNTDNCNKFINLLSVLNKKFSGISDRERRRQLYSTFIDNMKITNK